MWLKQENLAKATYLSLDDCRVQVYLICPQPLYGAAMATKTRLRRKAQTVEEVV